MNLGQYDWFKTIRIGQKKLLTFDWHQRWKLINYLLIALSTLSKTSLCDSH